METSPKISPLTAVELVHKGTDEHSVQEPAVGLRGKKSKWTNVSRIKPEWNAFQGFKASAKAFSYCPFSWSYLSTSLQDERWGKD